VYNIIIKDRNVLPPPAHIDSGDGSARQSRDGDFRGVVSVVPVQLRVVAGSDMLAGRLQNHEEHDHHGDVPAGRGRRMHGVPGSRAVQERGRRGGRVRGQDCRVRGALSGRRVRRAFPPGVRHLCLGHVRRDHHTGERVSDLPAVLPVPKQRVHRVLHVHVHAEREYVRHRVAVRRLLFWAVPHVLPYQRRHVGAQVRDDRRQPVSTSVDDVSSARRHRQTRPAVTHRQRREAQAQAPVHQWRCQRPERAVQLPAGSIPVRSVRHVAI